MRASPGRHPSRPAWAGRQRPWGRLRCQSTSTRQHLGHRRRRRRRRRWSRPWARTRWRSDGPAVRVSVSSGAVDGIAGVIGKLRQRGECATYHPERLGRAESSAGEHAGQSRSECARSIGKVSLFDDWEEECKEGERLSRVADETEDVGRAWGQELHPRKRMTYRSRGPHVHYTGPRGPFPLRGRQDIGSTLGVWSSFLLSKSLLKNQFQTSFQNLGLFRPAHPWTPATINPPFCACMTRDMTLLRELSPSKQAQGCK